jgi:magnesium-transporting ATPase (P-type)
MIEWALSFTGFLGVFLISGAVTWDQLMALDFEGIARNMSQAPEWVHPLAILVYFAGVVMAQVGNAFACRSETNRGRSIGWLSNPFLLAGVAVEIVLFFGMVLYNSTSQHPLGILFWTGIASFALIIYILDWLPKQWARRRAQGRSMETAARET